MIKHNIVKFTGFIIPHFVKQSYLADYEGSSLKALSPENVHAPAETPEQRGKIVGSSAVLSHLMISRYATTIAELRKLLNSQEYANHRGIKIYLTVCIFFKRNGVQVCSVLM